jgi:hypothetical protein
MLHDINIGSQRHVNKIRLQVNYLQQRPQKIIDASIADEILKFIKNFIHPPQKDFAVI